MIPSEPLQRRPSSGIVPVGCLRYRNELKQALFAANWSGVSDRAARAPMDALDHIEARLRLAGPYAAPHVLSPVAMEMAALVSRRAN